MIIFILIKFNRRRYYKMKVKKQENPRILTIFGFYNKYLLML